MFGNNFSIHEYYKVELFTIMPFTIAARNGLV